MGTKHIQSNSSMVGKVSKSHKMMCKAVDRPSKDLHQSSPKSLVTASSNKLDPTASPTVACCRIRRFCTYKSCTEYGQHNEISLKLIQKNGVAEPFSSKKFVRVADKQCKQLLDALGIFNSNKELFVNLLQDPNSLLTKHIEDSSDSQMRTFFDSSLSENKIREVEEYKESAYGQNLKPCEESDDSLSLERIVVLKPNRTSSLRAAMGIDYGSSPESHSSLVKNVQSDKGTLFSFRQIKRKMKQAMRVGRKEGECLSANGMSKKTPKDDVKLKVMEAADRGVSSSFQDSLKRDQLDKTFYSRNGDKTASTSESTDKTVGLSAVTDKLKRPKSKKHEGDQEGSRKMKAKPWGWVMCFSDDDILPSSHLRYSHVSNKKFVYQKKSKPQNDEKQSCKTPIIEGSLKIVKDIATIHQERDGFCEASSGSDNNSKTGFCQRTSKIDGFGENGNLELSKPNLPLEVQPSAFSVATLPSSLSRLQTMEDLDGLCDRKLQPLSETIHDQLLAEAASTNLTSTSGTAEVWQGTGLARLQELLNPAISSFDCCGSISHCVLELLQVSKQNWNELSLDCQSSAWLQTSFTDKVKMFSSQLCGDCVLLFDYFNEVLEDVFHCYIRCSPWLSPYKAHIQAPNKESAFYHEVMQHLDWPLLQQHPPQTLNHLCLRDLRSRTWINCSTETEDVVTIIAESVLKELIIESVVYLGL
ncbi:uncharacterized protein LOC111435714 isoform X2 [Cucurbita moschata]|uniref:Uncharacterized protein LOC111435714 isoform X2 n=1 Tax=Cucurbita moschata TaxID=3662 RepID=A0A6J1EMD9_CUCMO|nr:uncharacterized protein LOC111435714 isoform X2 [Cucurbita moschata]